jgi:hypothetical protein
VPTNDDDQDGGAALPTAARVAGRALVLTAVVCRSTIEADAGSGDAEALQRGVLDWVGELDLTADAEESELALLRAPLGTLSERQASDGAGRSESLVVLAWALGRCEMPAYDVQADPFAIASALGFRYPRAKTVLADPQLRSLPELTSLADTLRALHGRLTSYSRDWRPVDFAAVAARSGLRVAEGDLEVRGMPLFGTAEPVWRAILGITRERQEAAHWLLGGGAAASLM